MFAFRKVLRLAWLLGDGLGNRTAKLQILGDFGVKYVSPFTD